MARDPKGDETEVVVGGVASFDHSYDLVDPFVNGSVCVRNEGDIEHVGLAMFVFADVVAKLMERCDLRGHVW